MRLADLEKFNPITIQCHDNPDADALASGYGLYCYYKSKGKDVRLVYSGRNRIQKANLCLMKEKLNLPVEYIEPKPGNLIHLDGLLITVDCQYGASNVTGLTADEIAIIDHHHQEIHNVTRCLVNSALGSCSTLVWKLLAEEGYRVDDENGLGTALYYGLYTDTNQLAEVYNPWDRDMLDAVPYEKGIITLFRNSNLSLKELEIAGIALIRYSFNNDYGFAVIKAQPCDPNILGLISDFLLQVDVIKTCVVFNEINDGYKFSVRSCIQEVNASELAVYIAQDMGSGGGHYVKAGGFISLRQYEEKYPTLHAEGYFNNRMVEYFDSFELIYPEEYAADISGMKMYKKRLLPMGYVAAKDMLPVGTPVTIRTLDGDSDLTITDDLYILIGVKGEIYLKSREEFMGNYRISEQKYCAEACMMNPEYMAVIKNRADGQDLVLPDYARQCFPLESSRIYAKCLEKGVKVFSERDKEKYMLGKPGDYLAVRADCLRDIFVVDGGVFGSAYEEVF